MSFVDPRSRQARGDRVLREIDLAAEPLVQLRRWFDEAVATGVVQPEAMALATATRDGQPSVRMVLLRGLDERGLVFFTNYDSRKGCELTENPRAALVLFWEPLERQVRVEGRVEKATEAESDAYFQSRPRGSRLGAWASPQSAVLPGRDVLDRWVSEVEAKYAGQEVPRPPNWGGYRVVPDLIEFWQGQPSRLHDRLCYRRQPDGSWKVERLAP
jgi:pyridoxamine 5'-phosphate oxidase